MCIERCTALGFAYAATRDGQYCACGDVHNSMSTSTECTTSCNSDIREICGGSSKITAWKILPGPLTNGLSECSFNIIPIASWVFGFHTLAGWPSIFTSCVSGRGHRIGAVFLCVCVCVVWCGVVCVCMCVGDGRVVCVCVCVFVCVRIL